jgi:hypothetical protein
MPLIKWDMTLLQFAYIQLQLTNFFWQLWLCKGNLQLYDENSLIWKKNKKSNWMFWMKAQNIELNIEPNQRKFIIVNQRVQIW